MNSVLTWWRRSFRNVECGFSSTKFPQTRSISICTRCCISLPKSSPSAPTHPLQSPWATPAPAATKYLTPHHLPLSLPDLLSLVRSLPVTGAVAAQVLPSRSLSPPRYCVKTLPTCAHNIFGHLWNFTRRRTRSCRAFRRSSPSSPPPRWQLLYYLLEKECQVGTSLVEDVFRVVERKSFSNIFSCNISSFGSSVLILSRQKKNSVTCWSLGTLIIDPFWVVTSLKCKPKWSKDGVEWKPNVFMYLQKYKLNLLVYGKKCLNLIKMVGIWKT